MWHQVDLREKHEQNHHVFKTYTHPRIYTPEN